MTQSSSLEIERYFFTKVSISAVAGSDSQPPTDVKTAIDLRQKKDDERRFLLQLNVTIGATGSEIPQYRGMVSAVGYFTVRPSYKEHPAELVAKHGAAILYNAIREMVVNVTSRGPWPVVTLPAVSFKDLLNSEPIKRGQPLRRTATSAPHSASRPRVSPAPGSATTRKV